MWVDVYLSLDLPLSLSLDLSLSLSLGQHHVACEGLQRTVVIGAIKRILGGPWYLCEHEAELCTQEKRGLGLFGERAVAAAVCVAVRGGLEGFADGSGDHVCEEARCLPWLKGRWLRRRWLCNLPMGAG